MTDAKSKGLRAKEVFGKEASKCVSCVLYGDVAWCVDMYIVDVWCV